MVFTRTFLYTKSGQTCRTIPLVIPEGEAASPAHSTVYMTSMGCKIQIISTAQWLSQDVLDRRSPPPGSATAFFVHPPLPIWNRSFHLLSFKSEWTPLTPPVHSVSITPSYRSHTADCPSVISLTACNSAFLAKLDPFSFSSHTRHSCISVLRLPSRNQPRTSSAHLSWILYLQFFSSVFAPAQRKEWKVILYSNLAVHDL
jgi:hypothetical protein